MDSANSEVEIKFKKIPNQTTFQFSKHPIFFEKSFLLTLWKYQYSLVVVEYLIGSITKFNNCR